MFRSLEELTLSVEADATFSSIEEFLLKNVSSPQDVQKYKNPYSALKNLQNFVDRENALN